MMVTELTSENFETETTGTDQFVLIDFWASWCGPCQMLSPLVDEIANEHEEIKVCKVNVDEQPELAQKYGVASIPMLLVMHNGNVVQKSVGFQPKDSVLALIHD